MDSIREAQIRDHANPREKEKAISGLRNAVKKLKILEAKRQGLVEGSRKREKLDSKIEDCKFDMYVDGMLLEQHVKPSVLAFVSKLSMQMQQKLPRELRDMIYIYIFRLPKDAGETESHFTERSLLDPGLVGLDIAREGAEIYYRHNHLEELWSIKDLLLSDVFQIGVKPYEHIRNLRFDQNYATMYNLQIDPRFATPRTNRRKPYSSWINISTEWPSELETYEDKRKDISALLKLSRPENISILLRTSLDDDIDGHRIFFNILQVMRDVLYYLTRTGVKVHIEHRNDSDDNSRTLLKTQGDVIYAKKAKGKENWEGLNPSDRYWPRLPPDYECYRDRYVKTIYSHLKQRWGLEREMILGFPKHEAGAPPPDDMRGYVDPACFSAVGQMPYETDYIKKSRKERRRREKRE
ncbi:hypothetical protein K491DRAFT_699681 [Lophiostoma macrostomum CBS 122681]|uniref:Uncharacterized protein n=1 Tax=Lophiostoma macrostomum CBS 122681 TaxID=1314788 RepID=A0A6A6SID8_9PLEO|nr:hypothetical protein K491DRAFT_699681 [Lophiostoma macrostomum CBS 122681]